MRFGCEFGPSTQAPSGLEIRPPPRFIGHHNGAVDPCRPFNHSANRKNHVNDNSRGSRLFTKGAGGRLKPRTQGEREAWVTRAGIRRNQRSGEQDLLLGAAARGALPGPLSPAVQSQAYPWRTMQWRASTPRPTTARRGSHESAWRPYRSWWYCTYGTRPWSGAVAPDPNSRGAWPDVHTFCAPKFNSPRHGRRTLMPRSTPLQR